jgi:cytochrome c2
VRALLPLVAFVLLGVCAGTASAAEKALDFRGPSVIARLDAGTLAQKLRPRRLAVYEPIEHKVVEFEGFDAREVLDLAYGPRWRTSEELLMTCLDGFQPSVPAQRFIDHTALLAYKRLDQPQQFTVAKPDAKAPKIVELGPWYLVWENQRDAVVRADLDYGWPYQLVAFEPVRFLDRFPRLAPGPNVSPAAQRGFLAWRMHCQKCHMLNGEGGEIGPELNRPMNVTEYWQPKPLRQWVLDPTSVRVPNRMPPLNPGLPNREAVVEDLIAYLTSMKDQKRP